MMTMAEYSKAKTSVWWDIENCEVPKGWDAHAIAQNVGSALLNMNYSGPVSILSYGDTNLIPHHVQQALSSTGVGLNHVPAGVKDASDKKILVGMLLWAVDNPAPANIMLISGDRDFSNALHQLSMRRYTILLAQPPHASAPLVAAAKNVWLWTSLASGGPPLTSGESSHLVNNGRCNGSYQVSELAQSSKPTGSTSVAGHTNVTSSNSFRAQLLDKRHTSQAAFVATPKTHVSVSAKTIQEADVVQPVWCTVCQISCTSKEAYAEHTHGKGHRNNMELQSGKAENVSRGAVPVPKEVLARQKNKRKARRSRTRPNAGYACRLCNVACQSQVVYDSHLKGQKHAAMLSKLDEALITFNKLQKKSVGEKSQPRETIGEPQIQSQDSQEKHVAMVNQTEATFGKTKNEALHSNVVESQRGAREKSQPRETMAESQLQSENTQEETTYLEKRSEELREILLGTSKSSVKEKVLRTKDQRETVYISEECILNEARECFDGIDKPVNQSEEATDHSVEVKERRAITPTYKLCHLCVVICDSQGVSTLVCDSKYHWTNRKQTKAAYENHTNGKKHRHKEHKLSEDNAEKGKDQTAFYSQNHAAMVKDQTENALDTEKLREALEQEDQEEVKEVNAISENLVHVFNGLNRESRVFKESRGCLDVIPERGLVSPDVIVTGKLEDEFKHKQEREKECAGRKEHLGEAAEREESKKVQVDNLWTRLWWGKS